MKIYYFILTLFFCSISFAQTTISGTVRDGKNEPIAGSNVKVAGESAGTVTDGNGKFTLKTSKKPPFTIEVSSIGYGAQKMQVTANNQSVDVVLQAQETKLDEIVVSASRTPERILESPVTVERMGLQQIKSTTAANYYDGLENLKEVHFNTSSISFKSINTRGFSTIANTRFMQLVDGMDNSSPALNFPLGNLVGISELDVQSVELLPGASSALYGANAFNGILFMNSKSPFTNQGISTYVKYGQTNQQLAGANDYWDYGIRAAHAFTKHFAMKGNFTYMSAKEWVAGDTSDVNGGAIGHDLNRNYNGMNVYGDEASTFIPNVGQVSRTGYREQDLTNNNIKSLKADFALHFKPWADDREIILQHKVGMGNTIYQGASRYMLKNFIMQQTRAEFKGKNFFVRGYMSTENAGDSYDMQFTALNMNRLAKSDTGWFTDYATAFLQSQIGLGYTATQADKFARGFADNNINNTPLPLTPHGQPQFQPGTDAFQAAFNSVTTNAQLNNYGSKFLDQSKLYHTDYNYNFKNLIKFAEIQVGGSAREYVMNSKGTIFTDFDGPLKYSEFGFYTQVQKKLLNDRLKFTGSIRYDKSKNFEGQYSPRLSVVYSAGQKKNHNIRASFQTGFRNPTTQDQYIGLNIGTFALIGSAPDNLNRYTETQLVSPAGQALNGNQANVTLTGLNAYNNAYTSESVALFKQTGNTNDLQVSKLGYVKPEQVKAFELGYKGIVNNDIAVDLNAYYNIYNNFATTARVYTPYYGDVNSNTSLAVQAVQNNDIRMFQVYSNSLTTVNSFGFGAGLTKKVYKDFELGANYNHAEFSYNKDQDPNFISYFNTPKHRVKASFGNPKLFKNFGFNINWRWSDTYQWQSSFADGTIPVIRVFDAQVSYAIPSLKSVIKASASNLGGPDYLQVVGAGKIGQQYLVSLTINP